MFEGSFNQPNDILNYIIQFGINFTDSGLFFALQVILGIYVIVLFLDVVLLLYLRGIGSDIRTGIMGADLPTESQGAMRKKWDRLHFRLKSDNPSQYKVAVLEADAIVDDILQKIGYEGSNMSERLEGVQESQLEHVEELRQAHLKRNRIVHESDYEISREEAKELIDTYENVLRYMEFI